MQKLSAQKTFCLLLLFFFTGRISAQMQVTAGNVAPFTPQNLISSVFLGEGVKVTSITYNGAPTAVGYFTDAQNIIGINKGIVMSTGLAANPGNNTGFGSDGMGVNFASSDNTGGTVEPDLAKIATESLQDVAVYTIKFIPTADTLRFRYCFASEEYPEFACSNYNDVFGFFIQGPGYPVPTNIALIPNSTLSVAINNIHPPNPSKDPCPSLNEQYYNANLATNKQPVYDGFTDVFVAQAIVQPCKEYTIKLAIADVFDGIYDSGVFLEAKSFGTNSLRVEVETASPDGSISEGCLSGMLNFILPNPQKSDFPIDFKIGGTAANGADYQNIPAQLSIAAGKTELNVPLSALKDNLDESSEFITIDFQRDVCSRDTVTVFLRDNKLLPPKLPNDTTFCAGESITLNGALPVQAPPPPSFANNNKVNLLLPLITYNSTVNVFGVTPAVVGPNVIRSVCFDATHSWIDDLDIFLEAPGGQFIELITDVGTKGPNFKQTCFTPKATTKLFYTNGTAPFTGNWAPEGKWEDLYGSPVNGTWRLTVKDDGLPDFGSLDSWSITFEPSYEIKYQWTPTGAVTCATCPSNTVKPTQTTTYSIQATDTYGCSVGDTVRVGISSPLPAPASVTCGPHTASTQTFFFSSVPGADSYQANVNGTGWVPTTTLQSHTVTKLPPSSIVDIEIRAALKGDGCGPGTTATCVNCVNPSIKANVKNVTCVGSKDGVATLSVANNFNPPYTFALSGVSNTTGSFTGLSQGTYTVTVTDKSGCDTTFTFQIKDPAPIKATVSPIQNTSCFGGRDGALQALVNGGTGAIQYIWSDPNKQITAKASGLPSGAYSVTVTDENGCTASASGSISSPPAIVGSYIPTPVKCHGGTSGAIKTTLSGGRPGYQVSWQGPFNFAQFTPSIDSLYAGLYQVTITDLSGCTHTDTVRVTQPLAPLSLKLPVIGDTVCFDGSNGVLTVNVAGGTTPYKYKWDAADQTTATARGLKAGVYHTTVTDGNGCIAIDSSIVVSKGQLFVYLTKENPTCHDGKDGFAEVSFASYAATETDPARLAFIWNTNPAQTQQLARGLSAATQYAVTATDADGCTAEQSIQIGNPPELFAKLRPATPVSCFGGSNGAVAVFGQGGQPPYSYIWSPNTPVQTDSLASRLSAGSYRASVSDSKGCVAIAEVLVTQPPQIKTRITATDVLCFGDKSGKATVQASGGVGNFQYAWSNGATGVKTEGLGAGFARVTVTDQNRCAYVDSVKVQQPAEALGGTTSKRDAICFGGRDGEISIAATGGTPPYRYTLNNDKWNGSPTQIGLKAGVYGPRVQDKNGCISDLLPVAIGQRSAVQVDLGPDFTLLLGKDTSLLATVTGAVGDVKYKWSREDEPWLSCLDCANPNVDSLHYQRTFEVFVTDSTGCTAESRVTILVDKPRRIHVPTGFTPNDDGENDVLLVHGQASARILDFRVYDRWGELLYRAEDFKTNDASVGWDGRFRGQDMNPGVYIWWLEVEYMDGAKEVFKGNTTLLR